nr:unnamed protein product [Spirometra erinaceieuropaei]
MDDTETPMGNSPNRRTDGPYRMDTPDIKRSSFVNSPAGVTPQGAQTIPRCLGETLFALASTATFSPACADSGLTWLLKVIAASVYQPIQELGLNETEIICLKAIIFFSPTSTYTLSSSLARTRCQDRSKKTGDERGRKWMARTDPHLGGPQHPLVHTTNNQDFNQHKRDLEAGTAEAAPGRAANAWLGSHTVMGVP